MSRRSFPLADGGGCCVAVHVRHLAVHEDEVVGEQVEHLDRLLAVGGHVHAAPELFQHSHGHFLVCDVVLRQEHAGTEDLACGHGGGRYFRMGLGRGMAGD